MAAGTRVYDVSKNLLDCIGNGLEQHELPIPCRICVVPGQIAYDSCSEGGQLAVTTVQEYNSYEFPAPATDVPNGYECGNPYFVAEYLFSLMRCAPSPQGMSAVVPCVDLDETALLIGKDAYVIRTSVQCCLNDMMDQNIIADYTMAPVVRVGPQGGCVGNEMRIRVGYVWLGS